MDKVHGVRKMNKKIYIYGGVVIGVVALLMLPTVMGNDVTRDFPTWMDNFYYGTLEVESTCGGVNGQSRGDVYHYGSASIYVKAGNGDTKSDYIYAGYYGSKSIEKYGSHLYMHTWGTQENNPDGTLKNAGTVVFVEANPYVGDTLQIYNGEDWVSWVRVTSASDTSTGGIGIESSEGSP